MKNILEKLKTDKKSLITLCVAVVAIILVIILIAALAKPSYKSQIKKWAKACESDEKMEKYVKKYVNLRALYASEELISYVYKNYDEFSGITDEDELQEKMQEAFDDEYKDAKKKDYTDDDFIEDAVSAFQIDDIDGKVKITDIGKLEEDDDDIKGAKSADIEFEYDDKTYEGTASFYKGKIVSISASEKD